MTAAAAALHPNCWAARVCLEPGPKAVLAVLADCAGAARDHCWPGLAYIAHKCRRSVRWVQLQIEALQAAGLVEANQRRGHRSNLFRLAVGLGDMSRPDRVEGQGSFNFDAQPVSRVAPGARQPQSPAVDNAGVFASDRKKPAFLTRSPLRPEPTTEPIKEDLLASLAPSGGDPLAALTPSSEEIDPSDFEEQARALGISPAAYAARKAREARQAALQAQPPQPAAADPYRDPRWGMLREAVAGVRALTGRSHGSARSLVGKMLKGSFDDVPRVLGRIREAEDLQPVDPSAWLLAHPRAIVAAGPIVPEKPRNEDWRIGW